MTTPNQFPPQPSPEQRFTELVALTAENFTPGPGYRLSLSDVNLRELEKPSNYHQVIEQQLGVTLTPEASFVYTYSPKTDDVGLTAARFGLGTKVRDETGSRTLADCIYLQNCESGFVQTYGLGADTMADTPDGGAVLWPHEAWRRLFEPLGLYHLGGGDELLRTLAGKLDLSNQWSVREQQVVPLSPKEDDLEYQMIIVRKRGIAPEAPTGRTDDSASETEEPKIAYTDQYEVTFQTIEHSGIDERARHIDEVTLSVLDSFVDGPKYSLDQTEYIRYQDPFVIGDAEVTPITSIVSEPTPEDFKAFVRLLEDSYSS